MVAAAVTGWFRLWQATLLIPQTWNDTKAYLAVAAAPIWSRAFWLGVRPPGLPLLWKFTGSPNGLGLVQAIVAVTAWSLLAWMVGSCVPGEVRATVASLTVLIFSTATPIFLWDNSILTESLSISMVAALTAGVIWLCRAQGIAPAALTVAALLGAVLLRDSQIGLALFVGLGGLLLARVRRRDAPLSSVAWNAGVIAMEIALVGALLVLYVGRTEESVRDIYFVRVFPYPARVDWFAKHGMPQARQVNERAKQTPVQRGAVKVVGFTATDSTLVPLNRWLANDGTSTYGRWLIEHPQYVVTEPLKRPERTYNSAQGNLLFYSNPQRTDSIASYFVWPPWQAELAYLALIPLLVLRRKLRRSTLIWCPLGLAAIGFMQMAIAWHSDGQEVTRHTLVGQVQLRLGLLCALLFAVLGVREQQSGAKTTPG